MYSNITVHTAIDLISTDRLTLQYFSVLAIAKLIRRAMQYFEIGVTQFPTKTYSDIQYVYIPNVFLLVANFTKCQQ